MPSSRLRPTSALAAVPRAIVILVLATLGFVAVGSTQASAAGNDSDVWWAVRTANSSYGSDRANYSYSVNPGGQIHDALIVLNHGKKALTLAVSAADGYTTDAGQLDLNTKDQKSTGVGAWVRTATDTVTVKPGKSARVPFDVSVPSNATPGDHVGGIITSLAQAESAQGINVDRRLAIRVSLRVGGDLAPALRVEKLHVHYSGSLNPLATGDATISYTIHNTGNAILTTKQAVSAAGPFGVARVSADRIADSPQLLPGDTWRVTARVHGVVPSVIVGARVTLSPLLTDASGTTSALAPVTTTAHGWAVPWTFLVLLIVVAGLAGAGVRVRQRAKTREEARVQEAVEQALAERETADQ